MKTLGASIILLALLATSSCGERRTATENTVQKEEPGVGMTLDSANQKLDSTIKAADTIRNR